MTRERCGRGFPRSARGAGTSGQAANSRSAERHRLAPARLYCFARPKRPRRFARQGKFPNSDLTARARLPLEIGDYALNGQDPARQLLLGIGDPRSRLTCRGNGVEVARRQHMNEIGIQSRCLERLPDLVMSWSTARQSQCLRPAMETTTSSRCQTSRPDGRRRRICFA